MYKVGIIGLNFGGNVHIPAYLMSKDFEITGLYENGSGKSELLKRKFLLNCKIYKDLDKMIKSKRNNLIDVCSPTFTHSYYLKKILNEKKNVICEKPMGKNFSEIDGIAMKFRKKKLLNIINYEFRYEPLMNQLKKYIKCNNKIKKIKIDWLIKSKKNDGWKADISKGGGVVNELLSHVIDYIFYLFDLKEKKSLICVNKNISINDCNLILRIKKIKIEINILRSLHIKSSKHSIHIENINSSANLIYFHPFSSHDKILTIKSSRKKKDIKNIEKKKIKDDRILSFYNLLESIKKKGSYQSDFKNGEMIRRFLDGLI